MLCGRPRRCTFTGSPAQNNRSSFWPALPSLPQLGSRKPPILDRNRVAHHAVQSASTLHLHREPCSEQQAQFLGLPYPPFHSWALGNPPLSIRIGWPIMLYCRCRGCTSTGSPAQSKRPRFSAAYPPSHSWALGNPPLSIRIRFPIMLCGPCGRCTCIGSPAQYNRPRFWAVLPSLLQLVPRRPVIVDQNRVAHHAVRSASALHLHREPFSEQQVKFLACFTLPPTVGP